MRMLPRFESKLFQQLNQTNWSISNAEEYKFKSSYYQLLSNHLIKIFQTYRNPDIAPFALELRSRTEPTKRWQMSTCSLSEGSCWSSLVKKLSLSPLYSCRCSLQCSLCRAQPLNCYKVLSEIKIVLRSTIWNRIAFGEAVHTSLRK